MRHGKSIPSASDMVLIIYQTVIVLFHKSDISFKNLYISNLSDFSNLYILDFSTLTVICQIWYIGWSRGAPGTRPPGPNSLIFMQFSAKKLQNNYNLGFGAPPSGKSWIRHCGRICQILPNFARNALSSKTRLSENCLHYILILLHSTISDSFTLNWMRGFPTIAVWKMITWGAHWLTETRSAIRKSRLIGQRSVQNHLFSTTMDLKRGAFIFFYVLIVVLIKQCICIFSGNITGAYSYGFSFYSIVVNIFCRENR